MVFVEKIIQLFKKKVLGLLDFFSLAFRDIKKAYREFIFLEPLKFAKFIKVLKVVYLRLVGNFLLREVYLL